MTIRHERTSYRNRLDIFTRFFEATLSTSPAGWEEESAMTLALRFGPPVFYQDHRFYFQTSWFVPTFMFHDAKPKKYGPYVQDLIATMGANEAWNYLHPTERPLPTRTNNVEYEVIPE